MTADRLYHAALRAELTRRLDVRWRPVDLRIGAAEIDGLHDRNLLRAFSKRRAQVLAQQEDWGNQGIAAGKAAALATRKPKDHTEPEASFYERVASGLAEHGIGPAELELVCQGGRVETRELCSEERARLLDALASPAGLTAQASTFARAICWTPWPSGFPWRPRPTGPWPPSRTSRTSSWIRSGRCWSPSIEDWTRPATPRPSSWTWSGAL